MLLRLFIAALFLNGITSFVLFTHSVIYDTQDFFDNRNITLPSFCSTYGCNVYVAPMPDYTASYAKNVKIFSEHIAWDNNDLYYISTGYLASGAKAPDVLIELPAGDYYFIENMNNADPLKDTPAQLTVYVVSRAAPNIDSSAVFDSTRDIPNPLPATVIMLMDNSVTTLEIAPSTSANSVVMRTVGFDNADGKADGCNYVLDTESSGKSFPGVEQQLINTQHGTTIWTVLLSRDSSHPQVILDAAKIRTTMNYSLEVLRSSSFPPDTFYYLISNQYTMNVHFEWDFNVLPDHPVIVTSNGTEQKYYGTNHKQLATDTLETQNVKVEWERYNTGSFMARFTTEPLGKVTDPYERDTTTTKGAAAVIVSSVFLSTLLAIAH